MDEIFSVLSAGAKFKKKNGGQSNVAASNVGNKQAKRRNDLLSAFDDDNGTQPDADGDNDDGEDGDDEHIAASSSSSKKLDKGKGSNRDEKSTHRFTSDEEINAFRNRLQIKVKGSRAPPPAATFAEMKIVPSDLKSVILQNIEQSAWKEPTPIQMQAIPIMLGNRDILASAPTGSGKTAAFLIPVLSKLGAPQKAGIRALLLAPTKELAEQIHREALRLCTGRRLKISLLKKVTAAAAGSQKDALSGVDLLVATPMRLLAVRC